MSRTLSARARAVSPSATLQLNALAAHLRAQGYDVISMGAGEPDFPTPAHICEAAVEAIRAGKTRYTDAGGLPALREALGAFLFEQKQLRYAPDSLIVCTGAKQALLHAFEAILDPGDEVVLPAPYWVSYPEMIRMAGGAPVPVFTRAEDGFLPSPEQLAAAVTPRTKALLINSPANPSGAVWPRALLAEAAALAQKHDFYLVSDEIYETLRYDGEAPFSPAQLSGDAFARTILVSGFSKAYAMTGWRLGYAAAARPVIAAMTALQSHATGNANTPAQYAALSALTGPQECVRDMNAAFAGRRACLLAALAEQQLRPGIVPQGAFYLLLDVRPFLGRRCGGVALRDDGDFSAALLQSAHVAAVPGAPFGAPGFLRLSYALPEPTLRDAARRIGGFVRALQ